MKNGEGRAGDFREVGRLPAPGDNVAMATRRLQAGTRVSYEGSEFEIAHTVLEGHRFAVEPIAEGEDLLSWGLRFGRATRDIEPGDYACNEKILRVLRERFRPHPDARKIPRELRTRVGDASPEDRARPASPARGANFGDAEWKHVLDGRGFGQPGRYRSTTRRAPLWATGAEPGRGVGRATTWS